MSNHSEVEVMVLVTGDVLLAKSDDIDRSNMMDVTTVKKAGLIYNSVNIPEYRIDEGHQINVDGIIENFKLYPEGVIMRYNLNSGYSIVDDRQDYSPAQFLSEDNP